MIAAIRRIRSLPEGRHHAGPGRPAYVPPAPPRARPGRHRAGAGLSTMQWAVNTPSYWAAAAAAAELGPAGPVLSPRPAGPNLTPEAIRIRLDPAVRGRAYLLEAT